MDAAQTPEPQDTDAPAYRRNPARQARSQTTDRDPAESVANTLGYLDDIFETPGTPGCAYRAPGRHARQFVPQAPRSVPETGLSESDLEAIILKLLLQCGTLPGREIAATLRLPFHLLEEQFQQLKHDRLVVYKSSSEPIDYVYDLTELGCERARRHMSRCKYSGSAPVCFEDYLVGIKAQSLRNLQPHISDLKHAMEDLLLTEEMIAQLGEAAHAGLGMFLYGDPGNGKTSIAQRITRAFGECIWIPRAINAFGEVIRLYDPSSHEAVAQPEFGDGDSDTLVDGRWIRIRRPTIVAGGELTLDSLDITVDPMTGIAEAPLHMKANCGTMVIDDFGRQRMSPADLLNRWIVPLEHRYDFLQLPGGRKIRIPFDQLIIFSTNLEPSDLVDEAFLRRIPYKIAVGDPTEEAFRSLCQLTAESLGIRYSDGPIEYLLAKHFRAAGRPMRCCHPRDLMHQVRNYCGFREKPLELSNDAIDAAVKNYFAVMNQ